MDYHKNAKAVHDWYRKFIAVYSGIRRRMSRRRWLLAGVLFFLLVAAAFFLNRGRIVGQTVYVVRPIAAALYQDNGKPARDDEILYGMSAVVTGRADGVGYLPMRSEYGYDVRVHRDDVLPRDSVPDPWRLPPTHVVSGLFADVVAEPGTKAYPALLVLPRGAKVRVVGRDGEYASISLHNGGTGYVRAPLLREIRRWETHKEEVMRVRVVEDAMAYLGVSYRWGGKTPTGIDCSGLASMAYMLNGLDIHRNAQPRAGFPIALKHVPMPRDGHTRESLSAAKPGDFLYWRGHQAVYLGDGRFIHANGSSFDVRINSLIKGDADYREDLAAPGAILTWGTAFPAQADAIVVRELVAVPLGEAGRYRFFARLDGFAPTSAVLYPEGMGEGKPKVAVKDPAQMVYGVMDASNVRAPEYTYGSSGTYRPAVVFVNADGWLPEGRAIESEPFAMSGLEVEL